MRAENSEDRLTGAPTLAQITGETFKRLVCVKILGAFYHVLAKVDANRLYQKSLQKAYFGHSTFLNDRSV
jgi:hypothetical protein